MSTELDADMRQAAEPPGGIEAGGEGRRAGGPAGRPPRRRRLRQAARATRRRLRDRRRHDLGAAFDRRMAAIALGALLLVGLLLPVDGRVKLAMLDEPPGVRAFFGVATDVGLSAWYVYPSAALLLFIAVADWRGMARVGRRRVVSLYAHAAFLFASVATAALTTQVLKTVFGRARPALFDEEGPVAFRFFQLPHLYASFPSGHSTTMGAVTMVLMLWFKPLRVPALIAGLCFAFSRVVVLAHYPSDVVAGFTIGALVALTIARWLARRGVLFGYEEGAAGLATLLPERVGHWRDFGVRTVLGRLRSGA
jgi:membrane-associated phospholipid phosphatase